MDRPPHPPPPAAAPPPAPPALLTAWPRSAQVTTAFLLGIAATLLVLRFQEGLRWGSRPTDLERPALPAYRIDLNRASRAELLQLPSVGPNLAARIEERRRQRPFRKIDELTEVHGIGPTTLEKLRPWVSIHVEDADEELETPVVMAQSVRADERSAPASGMSSSGRRSPGKKEARLDRPIAINRASAEELQRLPGIGPKTAQKIIDERGKGPFKSVDELRRVSGIGPKTLDKLRPYVTVETEPAPRGQLTVASGQ